MAIPFSRKHAQVNAVAWRRFCELHPTNGRYASCSGCLCLANPTCKQNHRVMTHCYSLGGYGLRPNRPYALPGVENRRTPHRRAGAENHQQTENQAGEKIPGRAGQKLRQGGRQKIRRQTRRQKTVCRAQGRRQLPAQRRSGISAPGIAILKEKRRICGVFL